VLKTKTFAFFCKTGAIHDDVAGEIIRSNQLSLY